MCCCRVNFLQNNEPNASAKYVGHLHKSTTHQDTEKHPVLIDTDMSFQAIQLSAIHNSQCVMTSNSYIRFRGFTY
jgi:hypothetical protein